MSPEEAADCALRMLLNGADSVPAAESLPLGDTYQVVASTEDVKNSSDAAVKALPNRFDRFDVGVVYFLILIFIC